MKCRIDVNTRFVFSGTSTLARAIADFGLPDACEIIYCGRNVVALLESAGLVIKSYRVPGILKGWIYRWIRSPKSRRAYDNGMRLRELGLNTPEPAFAIECYGRSGVLRNSYYACSALTGWSELRGVEKRQDFPELARGLAEFIFSIHSRNVLMKDMTPGNILFRRIGSGFEFALVDINRMSFDVSSRRTLFGNFKALLDTEEGTVAVAREYGRIMKENSICPEIADFSETARRIYTTYQKKLLKRKRLKNMFRRHER